MADAPYSLTIRGLIEQSYKNSADHGFWDNPDTDETPGNKMMLMVSEIAEAFESFRDPQADQMVKVPASMIEALVAPNFYADGGGESTAIETARAGAARDIEALYEKWKAKPRGLDI